MSEQQELFGRDAHQGRPSVSRAGQSLVFSKASEQPMTKAQQAFNRCVEQIEKLRRRIEERRRVLDGHVAFCQAEILPLSQRITERIRDRIPILYGCLTRGLVKSKGRKRFLRQLVAEELTVVLDALGSLGTPELEKIYRDLHGVSFDEAANEDLEELKDDLRFMAGALGAEIDVDSIRPDMPREEMARKIAEWDEMMRAASAKKREDEPPPRKGRPKSKRTLEREELKRAAEELRERDLATLYKQLAKMLHPDLEQDPVRRLEKEAAMKRLTTAHRERDLHTMLRLEMEWILKERSDLAHLTEAKLAVYNAVLKEQVKELESEYRGIPYHPRYEILRESGMFGDHFDRELSLAKARRDLDAVERSIKDLEGPRAKEVLEKILKEYERRNQIEEVFRSIVPF